MIIFWIIGLLCWLGRSYTHPGSRNQLWTAREMAVYASVFFVLALVLCFSHTDSDQLTTAGEFSVDGVVMAWASFYRYCHPGVSFWQAFTHYFRS